MRRCTMPLIAVIGGLWLLTGSGCSKSEPVPSPPATGAPAPSAPPASGNVHGNRLDAAKK